MATVMLDLDGVALDFVLAFHQWFYDLDVKQTGQEMQPWVTWNHHTDAYGIPNERFVELLFLFAEEGGFTKNAPYPDVAPQMARLIEAGHTVHVVTDRPVPAVEPTQKWLAEHGIPFTTIDFSRDKTVFLAHGPAPYYGLDDRIENVQKMQDAGVHAYLLTRPWNEVADLPRVSVIKDFVDIILQENS
jgi:hypothetical protein